MFPFVFAAASLVAIYKAVSSDSGGDYDDEYEQRESAKRESRKEEKRRICEDIERYKNVQISDLNDRYGCDISFNNNRLIIVKDHTKKHLNSEMKKLRKEEAGLRLALQELKELKDEASK